jgi:hypothetical protein
VQRGPPAPVGKADTRRRGRPGCSPGLPLPGYAGLRFGLPAGRLAGIAPGARSRPDLVHVVTEGPLGWSAVSGGAPPRHCPVTSGFHTNFDRYSLHYGLGWLRPAVAAYLRSLHRRTRATMVPTAALAADLAGEGIERRLRVVGRGVDAELFDPQRRDPRTARSAGAWRRAGRPASTSAASRRRRTSHVSRLAASNRHPAPWHPHARMVWVGDGPAAAQPQAAERPDRPFCRHAHRRRPRRALRLRPTCSSFGSLTETYGNVVAEAMASALAGHSPTAAPPPPS